MLQTYQCPSCGANMTFDAKTQKLHCDHCGREETVAAYMKAHPMEAEAAPDADDSLQVFTCPSCGAQLVTDAYTAATTCAYCKSPVVLGSRLDGKETPDMVLPFSVSKEDAMAQLCAWAKGKPLVPRGFSREATLGQMEGTYVPYWMYCYDIRTQVAAECTRVRTERHRDEEVIHTDHFHVTRDISADYERVPADASEKMPDTIMEQLEPYQYQKLCAFEPAYLSGFFAEKYNYTSDQMKERVQERVNSYVQQLALDSINGYSSVQIVKQDIDLNLRKTEYALLPVWQLHYRYMGKEYPFYINGQTGKLVGKLPVSVGRMAAWFFGIAGIVFVITMLVMIFYAEGGM